MRRRLAALGATHMHGAGLERDRRPLQVAELVLRLSLPAVLFQPACQLRSGSLSGLVASVVA
jgi:hypothetical protein